MQLSSRTQIIFNTGRQLSRSSEIQIQPVHDDDAGPLSDVAEVNLTVLSVNDAPAGADNTVAGPQNGVITFTLADFGFVDTNDTPANNFARFKITTVPAAVRSVSATRHLPPVASLMRLTSWPAS